MMPAVITTTTSSKEPRAAISRSLVVWCVASSAAAGLLCWDARYGMNPDGVAYLDVATEALHQGPASFVNSHWSALYPLLIALSLWIVRPSSTGEFPVVHFVNWLIFVAALLSLVFFLRSWLRDDELLNVLDTRDSGDSVNMSANRTKTPILLISGCLAIFTCFISGSLSSRFAHHAEAVHNQLAPL